MRNVILSMMVSLDGQIARPDGNLDWFLTDADFEDEMLGLLNSVDAMIFGRVSYELLKEYWPTAGSSAEQAPGGFTSNEREVEFARLMNTIPKIVFSRTLEHADWGPVTIEREVHADAIGGRKVVVFAGASIATAFMNLDLVDEYRVMVHPIVLGKGIPLFAKLEEERTLALQRTVRFGSGVVLLEYGRA
ncbi:MAG TPA: dihydrofolate reductase family protein [Thermoanaerobaculia bacterium]|jgi:dihydrofolate reductase|nr:dihydrofolate reductase family protein [Thermoanaerobaculia bacterium]